MGKYSGNNAVIVHYLFVQIWQTEKNKATQNYILVSAVNVVANIEQRQFMFQIASIIEIDVFLMYILIMQ